MPPRKRKAEEAPAEEKPAAAVAAPKRVTRSAARKASEPADPPSVPPERKKDAPKKGKKGARAKKEEAENGNGVSEIIDGEAEKTTKTIVIEHCKQCRSFNRRAEEAKAGLTKGISGVKVVFNPDKPRKGCFEIREEGGEAFVTLLDMKRPFKPMKDLDMDKLVEDIVEKIKC